MTTTKPPVLTDEEIEAITKAAYLGSKTREPQKDVYKLLAHIDHLKAVLERAGADAVQIPEGYALVPIEPTKEMLAAGRKGVSYTQTPWLAERYAAMLQAAPAIRALKGKPAAAVANSQSVGPITIGNLPTLNQDEYPGLGAWWVHLRFGEENGQILARVYGSSPKQAVEYARMLVGPQTSGNPGSLAAALTIAEAALSDIGDADRDPGDDVAWCERRAAEALPVVRAAIAASKEGASRG